MTEVDVSSTMLDVEATFCYLGDMLCPGGGCDSVIAARFCVVWRKFRKPLPVLTSRHLSPRIRGKVHYVNFAMRWGTASKRASRRWAIPKRDSSLSGHWMGHLLSYSLSGGHDGAMLPINLRGLNGPLTSHFIFSSHMYFSLNTPTYYWSPMPN